MAPGSSKRLRPSRPAPAKAWGGRFVEHTDRLVEAFSRSIDVDRRLYRHDIEGSIAHCRTLAKARVLTRQEAAAMIRGLEAVREELDRDQFKFLPQDEDIHMAVERRLTELIGPLGGKLHTGRSRNDQVALDSRLYVRDRLTAMIARLEDFQRVLVRQAHANRDVAMPGYTHLQRAQPVLFAHHLLAYVEMLERDKGRLRDARTRANVMPLGSGALAGSNYPVDRSYTAALLKFPAVTQNSLDAVSDRDFMIETVAALALVMLHLSRMSEELILWATQEFHFVDLPDAFCTGSSMMPQKKNPDVPELVRGKTGRVYGHLMGLLVALKGLPLSYNRDMQEDKPALFDAMDQAESSLEVMSALMARLTVDREAVTRALSGGGMLATELADYLAMKGVPFREAHAITGRIVRWAAEQGRELGDLSVDELRNFSDKFEPSVLRRLTVRGAIDRKAQVGGTAARRVASQLRRWAKVLR